MTAESDPQALSLKRAQDLAQRGEFQNALDSLQEVFGDQLQLNVEALYISAVCLRKLKKYHPALSTLREVVSMNPSHARAYQEVGHIHESTGNKSEAISAFEDAVAANPTLVASWRSLKGLYQLAGNDRAFEFAQKNLSELESLPRELVAVRSHLHTDNLIQADQICRHFLKSEPKHVEGMRMLAEIASRARIVDDAEFILESAVTFEPEHVGARVDYANILVKRQKFARAKEVATTLVDSEPENPHYRSLLASTNLGLGETQLAIEQFLSVQGKVENSEHIQLSLGHAYKAIGKLDDAVAAYQQVYTLRPDFGDAYWSLANTKTYQFSDGEIASMLEKEGDPTVGINDRVHFCFALGKSYEDRKEYDNSFAYYQRGNDLKRESLSYKIPVTRRRVSAQKQACTQELFTQKAGLGCPAPDPIFIVGLPRAGSTLLEQILASHSQVDATMELPNILSLAHRLSGREALNASADSQYPAILSQLEDSYWPRFGQQYIDQSQVYRATGSQFIDKMPNNFMHIGLIKLILPNAKVIDARRHPMSCCFSGFKQLFAEGQEFSYGLEEIGDYYRNYVELMDHWDAVLPGFVLKVQHEDVVDDLEGQVRRMLNFCGLPFEQNCLDFHETERSVRTPSSEQVRSPIFRTSLDQWRNYTQWLQPVREALGPDIMQRYP